MNAVNASLPPVLLREDREGIATLTLNRPAQMNLLTLEMLGALQSAFDAIAGDASVRVVVLAGAGKGFCAGHDLKEIQGLGDAGKIASLFETCNRMMLSIQRLPQPVIARVPGAAAGPPPKPYKPGFFSRNVGKIVLGTLGSLIAYLYRSSEVRYKGCLVSASPSLSILPREAVCLPCVQSIIFSLSLLY